MKKRVFGRHFSRERDTRRALFRSLIRALVFNGKIVTTRAKAKAILGEVENLVTLAKDGGVAAKRSTLSIVGNDRSIAEYIYKVVVPALSGKKSGFTKLTNLPRRVGDRAKMVRLEWVVEVERRGGGKKEKQSKMKAEKVAEKPKEKEKLATKVGRVLKRNK